VTFSAWGVIRTKAAYHRVVRAIKKDMSSFYLFSSNLLKQIKVLALICLLNMEINYAKKHFSTQNVID
jgi:hypothetical protein